MPVHQPKGPLGLEADGVEVAARETSGCCKQAPRHGLSDPWLLRLQGSSGVQGHVPGEPVMPATFRVARV